MKIGYIYIIRNNVNDKVYIGQTKRTVEARWKAHKSNRNLKKNQDNHFYRALRKYGVNAFYPEILEVVEAETSKELKKKLDEREKHYILKYNSFNEGYNSTTGGEGSLGHKASMESRKKMSEKQRGRKTSAETRLKQSIAHKGRIISEESRLKLSKSKKGKSPSQEHIAKSAQGHKGLKMKEDVKEILKGSHAVSILQYTLDGTFIREWDTITEAAKAVNLRSPSSIRQCLNGKSKQSAGFIWKYKSQNGPKLKKFKRCVIQYTIDGEYLKEFESAAAAAKEIKITTDASIIRCCQGKYITAGGFKWKYKND